MGVLIIGDVHGCFHTLKSLIKENWDSATDQLVLVGDLINKGPHSVKTWRYCLKLMEDFPQQVIILRGNHEHWFIKQHRRKNSSKQFKELIAAFERKNLSADEISRQFGALPLHWENRELYVSHAGLSEACEDPFDLNKAHNLTVNRKKLKPLAKVQICGHQILAGNKPLFKASENAWHIDTGAWCNGILSALYFDTDSRKPRIIRQKRHVKDEL